MESLASLKDPSRPVKLGRPVNTAKSNVRVPVGIVTQNAKPHARDDLSSASSGGEQDMVDLD